MITNETIRRMRRTQGKATYNFRSGDEVRSFDKAGIFGVVSSSCADVKQTLASLTKSCAIWSNKADGLFNCNKLDIRIITRKRAY